MIVFVVGPSKSGKTAATVALARRWKDIGGCEIKLIDLDEELGQSDRGRPDRAIDSCRRILRSIPAEVLAIVDVGAGQLVEPRFREFLESSGAYPERVVVVDCGEEAFRKRHGENAPNEVGRYYGAGSLEHVWDDARDREMRVDSSDRFSVDDSAEQIRAIMETLVERGRSHR